MVLSTSGQDAEHAHILTISDWRSAQIAGNGLKRLYSLIAAEQKTNPVTHTWISIATNVQIQSQWDQLEKLGPKAKALPLYGVPFAVKDNIDCKGFSTTAACPAFSAEPAASDAQVIANLKAAGAIVVGKTNMDQFATGLVGTRSPHGEVPNSFDPLRVSGGSSSGSAVVVARGTVPFSLGTDTAGSGRVPAGFNNIIGLKPTRGALSARGVVPACRTLDCVSIFALTIDDAEVVLSTVEGYDQLDSYSRIRPGPAITFESTAFGLGKFSQTPSFAICADPEWFGRENHAIAYESALEKATKLGWKLTPIDFGPLFEIAQLLYAGPWVAERYAAIRAFIEGKSDDAMDPVVRGIIARAQTLTAADVFESEYLRQDLTRLIQIALDGYDGLLVPTTPTFPTLQRITDNPVEENSILGTYTNFVNFLDWSALSIPAGFRPDGLPFGITLISNHWQEQKLLQWAKKWTCDEARLLGATGVVLEEKLPTEIPYSPDETLLAVVGAHLTGFPLNIDLVTRGAELYKATTTSPNYRLFALNNASGPRKPGLKRVPDGEGGEIEVEVWRLPHASLGSFMATIPSPLGIGQLELKDGSWVQGFICEPFGLVNAIDITKFGGWRKYIHQTSSNGHTTAKEVSACSVPSASIIYNDGVRINHTPLPLSDQNGNQNGKACFSTVLVANRGEIAVRIIKTLHKMGIRAVSIYSDVDADAAHVHDADVALRLKGTSMSETYLNITQILELAKTASVDAIIPGYGFLSENADFATAVESAGMAWVGPTPPQMLELGLKHRARAIAAEANVPTVPGSNRLLNSLEDALEEAKTIGFPLMLKSTAGGGGIGLGYCQDVEKLRTTFESVQRQAENNFGNGGVFLERFIQNARHVEVQILGDGKGCVVAAGERDCSLQRRHQKVIEESPAIMIPSQVRNSMKVSAVRLATLIKYRNVGTVEFIYDVDAQEYYFLEVNTRLQVEHPITESVTGLDLVECMINIAANDSSELFVARSPIVTSGASIEVRLYAEDPLKNFQPCIGCITELVFPPNLRVDTWVKVGTNVTASYDPLVAKLIATGADRSEAVKNLAQGLEKTCIEGVQTNLDYLRQIVSSPQFETGTYTTKSLDSFHFISQSFKVLDSGPLSTVQDYPGRNGYWSIGIPPSGPMDSYSFRIANKLVGNSADSAQVECTLQGPTLKFHCDTVIAVTGAIAQIELDNRPIAMWQAFRITAGQTLKVGTVEKGYRLYLAIAGGVQVPVVMGSRSTFELGRLGGLSGRKLQRGDIVEVGDKTNSNGFLGKFSSTLPIPHEGKCWTIRVIPGPHGAPDFFTTEGLASLFTSEWKVHHNSNRLGVRLTGPQPEWGRQDGGKAGLHPSNVHDSPYSIGSVSFTGDEAVVLTCDGPSLGGFVVFCVIASCDLWMMGQVRPGDAIKFEKVTVGEAIFLEKKFNKAIESLQPIQELEAITAVVLEHPHTGSPEIVKQIYQDGQRIVVRQAGDRALLLDFGEAQDFVLRQNFHIFAFCELHRQGPIPGVEELTPGVYTLHVLYTRGLPPDVMVERLIAHVSSYTVPARLPSRTLHLPLACNDEVCRAAVDRYAATIRSDAPWLPSNVSFLEQLNGIEDMATLLYSTTFLVLGLGDVYMGSPMAIPLDPRHRIFGTKYNPSRSFTPRGAVGIGGQYMCIYATESPGGYQLVGRTVDVWDAQAVPTKPQPTQTNGSEKNHTTSPCMFQMFDRICFYPATESDLDTKTVRELVRATDGVLDLKEYEGWLEKNEESIAVTAELRSQAISAAPFLNELTESYQPPATKSGVSTIENFDTEGEKIKAVMPGRCYKCMVKEGDTIHEGQVLLCVESSKMEVEIRSPISGTCAAMRIAVGDLMDDGDELMIIKTSVSVKNKEERMCWKDE